MGGGELQGDAVNTIERMISARTGLIMLQPFYGTLALHMQFVERSDIETMMTNGTEIFYSPAFVETLSDPELIAVLAHEVSHCAYKHHTRRNGRDMDLWNDAGDYIVNRDLKRAMFVLPQGALLDKRFDDCSTEEAYTMLMCEQEQQQQQQSAQQARDEGEGDDSSQDQGGSSQPDDSEDEQDDDTEDAEGEGNEEQDDENSSQNASEASTGGDTQQQPPRDRGKCGTVVDAAEQGSEGETAEKDAEWDVLVRQALNVAAAQTAGTIPGHLQRLAEAIREPKEDWREVLRRFIDSTTRFDYSFSRPNRRFLHEKIIYPGKVPDGMNHLGIGIDVSGSISQHMLEQFISEVQAALNEGVADKVTIVYCDAAVQLVEEYISGDTIVPKIVGGGGTAFYPVLDHFADSDIAALVYFTDLEGTHGPEPLLPVLWANFASNKIVAPYGETIEITL
jgi:predicted metal-dependent peptidase